MFLLRLKHWQAFLLLFILPFILQYVFTRLLSVAGLSSDSLLYTLIDSIPTIIPTAWLWLIGLHFYRRLPASIKISALYFHLGVLYFAAYIPLLIYTLGLVRESMAEGTIPLGMLGLLLPMHLFATFCYLYVVYFSARCIASAEKQRIVASNEYIAVLFQIMFLPIGIWFIQPRINRLASKTPEV
ncbi:hypothetical protein [uncultured Pontibacter sp.]|uniref:hypothetical protein n=1 Tax=uncultured Pontibacter sp. TaxID=453356 RepID=UPI0026031F5A|nr:hypothetical protein [uncultured Pontibacter sp.]